MPRDSSFTSLTVTTAEALAESGCPDLAVYLPSGNADEVVLYRGTGVGLERPDYARLRQHGVTSVYVEADRLRDQEGHLEEHLQELLNAQTLEPAAKAEIAHHVGQAIARDFMATPASKLDLGRAARFVDEMVGCVLSENSVAPYLAHMAAHHRSTASHMMMVSTLGIMLGAKVFGRDQQALRDLGLAGLVHDTGKLGVHPDILNKAGKLSPEEMTIVQQHPIESVRLLGDDAHLSPAARQMIIQHHERVDGRGYPLGVSGDELELGSKILAIVDTFHAITGSRPYRASLTVLEANRVLATLGGRQFDPEVLAVWAALFSEHGIRPPEEWAVRGSDHRSDDLAAYHEHRPLDARRCESRFRPARLPCVGKIGAVCVYAGRLKGVTEAPDKFRCTLHDLSKFGVCLRTSYPLFRGEVVHLLLNHPQRPPWVEGVVAWCRRNQEQSGFRCGIRFATRLTGNQVGQPTEVEGLAGNVVARTD